MAILGGTRGMGRSLARLLAERGEQLILLGRDETELDRSAKDLTLRSPPGSAAVTWAKCDLSKPETFPAALNAAGEALGELDTLVITAADFASQDALENDEERLLRLLQANFAHTVLLCEQARKRMLSRGGGTLCVFSSVAGDRGRSPVVLYGASKAGLSAYLEGLDHRYRKSGLRTVCIKPGFVRTSMTEGLKEPPFAGDPDDVARVVLRAIDKGTPVVYAPAIWGWVMAVIRRLPRLVMRKVAF
ncbi:MAG: SDR family NAD(P)-dependent oxidoreductase [Myxococcaceae bacterium]